jgi:hypothetical protein
MESGARVRVKIGKYAGKIGTLIGLGYLGFCINFDEDPNPTRVIDINYTKEDPSIDHFLELIDPIPLHEGIEELGLQPA